MGTPGSGRYTNYTPLNTESAARYLRRKGIFNDKADGDKGNFGTQAELVAKAASLLEAGAGDIQMFPSNVDLAYGKAPKLEEAQVDRAGDPANPYVPDLSSPGARDNAINVDPLSKTGNGSIAAEDIKPNYVLPTSKVGAGSNSLGTQSPHLTAGGIGSNPLLKNLTLGKSKGTSEG